MNSNVLQDINNNASHEYIIDLNNSVLDELNISILDNLSQYKFLGRGIPIIIPPVPVYNISNETDLNNYLNNPSIIFGNLNNNISLEQGFMFNTISKKILTSSNNYGIIII